MNTERRYPLCLLCVILLLSFCACGAGGTPANRTRAEILYNGYLGLKLSLPADWYELERSAVNLTSGQDGSKDLEKLESKPYGAGGSLYPLLTIANGADENKQNYARIEIYAEDYRSIYSTMDEYVYATELANTGELADGVSGTLVDRSTVMLRGARYTKLTVDYAAEGSGPSYTNEFYLTRAGDLYFCAALHYASDAAQARSEGRNALETMLEFTEDGIRIQWEARKAYRNTYMDLTLTLPGNSYVVDRNTTNLSENSTATEKLERLEKVSYKDGGYYISLLSLRTGPNPTDSGYAELDLYAEGYPELDTMEKYLDAMIAAFTGQGSATVKRTLTTRDDAELNGRQFDRLIFETEIDGRSMTEECYVIKRKDLYLIAQIIYGDAPSETAAREMLGLLTLGE